MISASAQSATRLLEALEKLSRWAGDPPGGGPSGAPSGELVRAFEDALGAAQPPAAAPASEVRAGGDALLPGPAQALPSLHLPEMPADGQPPAAAQTQAPDAVGGPSGPQTAELVPGQGEQPSAVPGAEKVSGAQPAFQAEGMSRQDVVEELGRLLESVSGPGAVITPLELLRVQQLAGMLNMQAKAGIQTSQQTTQGMENLLRQSG